MRGDREEEEGEEEENKATCNTLDALAGQALTVPRQQTALVGQASTIGMQADGMPLIVGRSARWL